MEPVEQSCEFEFKTVVFYNTLTIKNFSSKRTGSLKSKKFTGTSGHTSQHVSWYYRITPAETTSASDAYTVIEVITDSTSLLKSQLHAEVETEFITTSVANLKTCVHIAAGVRIGDQLKVLRSNVTYYLVQNDTLTIRFKFSIHEEIQEDVLPPAPVLVPDAQLLDHFAHLLESEKFADVTVAVGTMEFKVHKAILTARSPVFAAMFEHEMQESQQNRVAITDIEPIVFREVLRFIYTGTVNKLAMMASELLAAADKYSLDKLREICEEQLGTALSVETATKTLYLADLYHADQLKQQAIQFISRNVKTIPTADWKSIISSNPDVAAEMFAEMARLN